MAQTAAHPGFKEFGFIVNLVVKGDNREEARAEVVNRLNKWFTEGPRQPPFPSGSLLLFGVNDSPLAFFDDEELNALYWALSTYSSPDQKRQQTVDELRYRIYRERVARGLNHEDK